MIPRSIALEKGVLFSFSISGNKNETPGSKSKRGKKRTPPQGYIEQHENLSTSFFLFPLVHFSTDSDWILILSSRS